jgi:hypothetical protein
LHFFAFVGKILGLDHDLRENDMVQLHHHKNSAAELILIPFPLIVKEATYNEGLELAHLLIHIRFPIPISSEVVAFHQIARLFFEFDRATPEISGLFSTLERNLWMNTRRMF